MNCWNLPFTPRVLSTVLLTLTTGATTRLNCVVAVCPAEVTVIVGVYDPAGDDELAINVSNPEGLVSVAAYFCWTPDGRLLTTTSAVSLVEVIVIAVATELPS